MEKFHECSVGAAAILFWRCRLNVCRMALYTEYTVPLFFLQGSTLYIEDNAGGFDAFGDCIGK